MAWASGVLVLAMALVCCVHAQSPSSLDVTTKYFGSHSFLCNNDEVNVSTATMPNKMYWLLPSGKLVSESSQLEDTMTITPWLGLSYNLTITRIEDDNFGYYICVLHYPSEVKVVRWGLNLNGPDYSDLRESYRQSAVVGAIAAAVMLGVVGLGCLIWHFRFSKRNGKDTEGPSSVYVYDNSAAVPMDDIEVKKQPAPADEENSAVADGATNGPSSNSIDVKL